MTSSLKVEGGGGVAGKKMTNDDMMTRGEGGGGKEKMKIYPSMTKKLIQVPNLNIF